MFILYSTRMVHRYISNISNWDHAIDVQNPVIKAQSKDKCHSRVIHTQLARESRTPPSIVLYQRCLHRVRRSNKVLCRTPLSSSLRQDPNSP
ncbi:hypothetical protein BDV35DRAFT_343514 [Aspergillus flavus]|uniref:Uncharacterized protein n=2 Tax=Aspergillus subgen. Circumdati TaxID=2720871 RepID=A0A5N6JCU8_9EURO|nr:hypothetical protein BDV35DRAFT_343514 [Aspergillus flavus]KAB8275754.1 hypothetical protein BDV30DRAFT_207364 [Aspergillus minisclerotigenes]